VRDVTTADSLPCAMANRASPRCVTHDQQSLNSDRDDAARIRELRLGEAGPVPVTDGRFRHGRFRHGRVRHGRKHAVVHRAVRP
jgi:hypothetical protein